MRQGDKGLKLRGYIGKHRIGRAKEAYREYLREKELDALKAAVKVELGIKIGGDN